MTEQAPHSWEHVDFLDDNEKSKTEFDPWSPVQFDHKPSDQSPFRWEIEDREVSERELWQVDDLAEDGVGDPWSTADASEWVEPEPLAEASSDLSETLYPPDNSVTDFSRELKIGELLANVHPSTEAQRFRCHELLSEVTIGRLRRLIPWLRGHTWCGAKLQLFLEFRIHWELPKNSRWWEMFHWSEREGAWLPRYNKATLSFDHARELVDQRWYYSSSPTDVIDHFWVEEWDDYAAWEVGVRSFANFAVFRAGVPSEQDWRELLFPQDLRSPLEVQQCEDNTFAPFMLPSQIAQYGCPRSLVATADPCPDLTDLAWRAAASLGGDRRRAWREAMAHFGRP